MKKYNIDILVEQKTALGEKTKWDLYRELAIALGVGTQHLRVLRNSRYCSGSTMNSDQLIIMSRILECSVDDLLNKKEYASTAA